MKLDIKTIILKAVNEADHPFCDEQDFRIAVVQKLKEELKSKNPLIITEYKYDNEGSRTNKIDIYLFVDEEEYAIELKYRPCCTKRNKENRDGVINLKGKNKGITITWQIDKLGNHKDEIHVSKNNNDYAATINWHKGEQVSNYYIMTQNTAYECVDDINKLQSFIKNKNKKAIGYAVVLSDQPWPEVNGHIDLEYGAQANKKQLKIHNIQVEKDILVEQEKLNIDKNTSHQGYWLEIAEIKHK